MLKVNRIKSDLVFKELPINTFFMAKDTSSTLYRKLRDKSSDEDSGDEASDEGLGDVVIVYSSHLNSIGSIVNLYRDTEVIVVSLQRVDMDVEQI